MSAKNKDYFCNSQSSGKSMDNAGIILEKEMNTTLARNRELTNGNPPKGVEKAHLHCV